MRQPQSKSCEECNASAGEAFEAETDPGGRQAGKKISLVVMPLYGVGDSKPIHSDARDLGEEREEENGSSFQNHLLFP